MVNNFYADPVLWQVPSEVGEWTDTALVLGNYPDPEFGDGSVALRPYESVVLRLTN